MLRTHHDVFVRYTYSYVDTDELKKDFLIAMAQQTRSLTIGHQGLLLQDGRPRRSQAGEKMGTERKTIRN